MCIIVVFFRAALVSYHHDMYHPGARIGHSYRSRPPYHSRSAAETTLAARASACWQVLLLTGSELPDQSCRGLAWANVH
jgi:hypothetical protein